MSILNFPLNFKIEVTDGQRTSVVAYPLEALVKANSPLTNRVLNGINLMHVSTMAVLPGMGVVLEGEPKAKVSLITEQELKDFGKKKK